MPRPPAFKVRKNIDSLSAQELADFRRAIKQALALNDKRGFDYFASWHGVPFGWCQHPDALFLPWHRLTCTGCNSRSNQRYPDQGIQQCAQIRLADPDSARSRRSAADAGPPYQQEWAYAFNRHGDTEGVRRFKQLTPLTYA